MNCASSVIPANAGIQKFKDWIPPYQVRGGLSPEHHAVQGLVKPGMTYLMVS